VDASGRAFDAYKPEYAAAKSGFTTSGKRKRKETSSGKTRAIRINFGGGRVNLTLSGNMLNSMRQKITATADRITAKLFFNSALEASKAKGNMRTRRFFALSRDQIKRITQTIGEAINGNR
jgi:hypothetical protein